MKRKGFTIIELIAVLAIMAIIALIVTPLLMSIIRKARISADKRSIDAYGRSIELAIAGYLMDNGTFPTSIGQLTIEYSGDEVVCSTTQLNGDSSVYLTGCTVGGRNVDYSYGTDKTPPAPTYTAYSVGDEVTYNNVDYYVIADSGTSEANVTLLKKTPLTVSEVNTYGGVGTANNHVNMYVTSNTSADSYQTAYNVNNSGYGGMAYYSSSTCGSSGSWGCTTDYAQSEIKYVVDAWKADQASGASSARLITLDDLRDNLGIELTQSNATSIQITVTEDTPTWVMGENYYYWTMTTNTDKTAHVWFVCIRSIAYVDSTYVQNYNYAVRPVITLSKSSLSS